MDSQWVIAALTGGLLISAVLNGFQHYKSNKAKLEISLSDAYFSTVIAQAKKPEDLKNYGIFFWTVINVKLEISNASPHNNTLISIEAILRGRKLLEHFSKKIEFVGLKKSQSFGIHPPETGTEWKVEPFGQKTTGYWFPSKNVWRERLPLQISGGGYEKLLLEFRVMGRPLDEDSIPLLTVKIKDSFKVYDIAISLPHEEVEGIPF